MKRTSLLMACMLVAACAQSPQQVETPSPAPAVTPAAVTAIDPVGVYDFTTMVDGQELSATMYITGSPGAYAGRIETPDQPHIELTSVTVSGNTMTVLGQGGENRLISTWVLQGDVLSGTWTFGDLSGEARGKKRGS
ncbi:MAG: hypothetical protein ABR543_16485 [Gemmatimonadaceae bacterium]